MAPTNPDRSEPALERDRANAARAGAVPPEAPSGRRQPQQARAQAKVDAILDATDALVVEVGVSEITTTLVAGRAGVAVGSLYRYFEGVPALVEGLAQRHIERFGEQLKGAFAGRRIERKRDAANLALDALVAYCRATPEFPALWRGAPAIVGACFEESAVELLGPIVASIVGEGLAVPTDVDFVRDVQIQWATASALLLLAFRRDPDGDPNVLAHLRFLFTLDVAVTGAVASDGDDGVEVDIRDLAEVNAPD
jgi:AcrR family transcriptional regulator